MSDEKNQGSLPEEELTAEDLNRAIRAGNDFSKWLKGIAGDLWEGVPQTGEAPTEKESLPKQDGKTGSTDKTPSGNGKTVGGKAAAKPGHEKEASRERLNRLWHTVDETVDWTDALGHDRPTDGLTSQRAWDLFHRLAGQVLEGDINAYVEVLTTLNPLGDLREYANGMIIRTPGPERLECSFECLENYLEEDGELYLGSMAIRIARDLFATLPVSEVYVEGNLKGSRRLGVTLRREQLKRNARNIRQPAAFIQECGGMLASE